MGIVTTKYVRKPLYVDAVQVTMDNFADVARWCQGNIGKIADGEGTDKTVPVTDDLVLDPANQYIHVRVHNPQSQRQTKANVGDWILYTDRGYKIYTEKAFKDNFDEVPVGTPGEAPDRQPLNT